MTTPSNAVPGSLDSQRLAPAALSPTRPLYWSIRRELWENRSIYIAPLGVAAVGLLGFLIGLMGVSHSKHAQAAPDAAHQQIMGAMPYAHAAWVLILTGFIVAVFYSLDALYGERRDRSILFWKSLPVSDLTIVIAKASIPLVVLPVVVFGVTVILHLIMLVLNTGVLLMSGRSVATMWSQLPLFQMDLVLFYGLTVMALWHAPLYGWLLLVSGWARRATFLWAVFPLLAIGLFERIAFRTSHFGSLLKDRLYGFAMDAFSFHTPDGTPIDPHFIPLAQITPGKFLSSTGLWVGLAFAAVFIAAAVRLRRYREPI
ncbi:MAG: ABC transporter permease [Candidatus Acidiferrum sp.]|jgi:ABC-2 type transport system permease protein